MRRTDEEFKAEVFRRSEDFRVRRRKRRQRIALACLPVLICCAGFMAVAAGGFGGFGASSESAAYSMEMMDNCAAAPAAAEEAKETPECDLAAPQEAAEMEGNLSGAGSTTAVLKIEVTSQPEMEEYARTFTDAAQTGEILEAIQAFYDDPHTLLVDAESGSCEGMGYRIIVTEEARSREYVLFDDTLCCEDGWLMNPECYRALEKLILREADR